MIIRLAAVCALLTSLAAPAMAQSTGTTNMEILRDKLKADRKVLVAANMELTDAEGAKFWPIYDAYQKDLQQINQRLQTTILAYAEAYKKGPIANDVAKKLIDEALAIDEAEVKLRSSAFPKVLAVLPATKAARYIQLENKIRAAVRYELAAGIPLIQ
jgi:Spy/CpxP family protein refolding chaperone